VKVLPPTNVHFVGADVPEFVSQAPLPAEIENSLPVDVFVAVNVPVNVLVPATACHVPLALAPFLSKDAVGEAGSGMVTLVPPNALVVPVAVNAPVARSTLPVPEPVPAATQARLLSVKLALLCVMSAVHVSLNVPLKLKVQFPATPTGPEAVAGAVDWANSAPASSAIAQRPKSP
jgi:hypothetical protein